MPAFCCRSSAAPDLSATARRWCVKIDQVAAGCGIGLFRRPSQKSTWRHGSFGRLTSPPRMPRLDVMSPTVTIQHRQFDAAIFDLDGVLTDTTSRHAAAWRVVFDEFLQKWAERQRIAFDPFDPVGDYLAYVDGRPHHDGVRSFLAARDIKLSEGSEHEPPDAETVRALTERKARLFRHELQKGINPEDSGGAFEQAPPGRHQNRCSLLKQELRSCSAGNGTRPSG